MTFVPGASQQVLRKDTIRSMNFMKFENQAALLFTLSLVVNNSGQFPPDPRRTTLLSFIMPIVTFVTRGSWETVMCAKRPYFIRLTDFFSI